MRVRVPTELQIMGKKVTVAYMDKVNFDGEDLSGACMAGANLIMLSLSEHDTEEELLSTLSHETAHYIIAKSGLSELLGEEKEEAAVVSIEENLLPLFRWNRRKWRKIIEVELADKD